MFRVLALLLGVMGASITLLEYQRTTMLNFMFFIFGGFFLLYGLGGQKFFDKICPFFTATLSEKIKVLFSKS